MTRFYEHTIIFNYTWDQVAQGFWKKYPNPDSKHVLTEDTVCRSVYAGRLFSTRLLSKTNPIPKWAERFITSKHVHIIEESIVDPVNKVFITYTRNLGYTKVMVIIRVRNLRPSDLPFFSECHRESGLSPERRATRKNCRHKIRLD
jgi:hypothetical protein